jgi:hypothetical protein
LAALPPPELLSKTVSESSHSFLHNSIPRDPAGSSKVLYDLDLKVRECHFCAISHASHEGLHILKRSEGMDSIS